MTSDVQLPNCLQCGAAPRARTEASCSYCGAVLPWELWDELSRLRIEVEPVEQERLDAALLASGRRRPRTRRPSFKRRMVSRPDRSVDVESLEGDPVVGFFMALAFLAAMALSSGIPPWIVLTALAVVVGVAYSIRRRLDEGERRVALLAKRRNRKKGRLRTRATVLAVGPPRLVPGTESTWRRVVTLYTGEGRQRSLLADAALEVAARDVVIAAIDGNRLVDVRREGQVEAQRAGT